MQLLHTGSEKIQAQNLKQTNITFTKVCSILLPAAALLASRLRQVSVFPAALSPVVQFQFLEWPFDFVHTPLYPLSSFARDAKRV